MSHGSISRGVRDCSKVWTNWLSPGCSEPGATGRINPAIQKPEAGEWTHSCHVLWRSLGLWKSCCLFGGKNLAVVLNPHPSLPRLRNQPHLQQLLHGKASGEEDGLEKETPREYPDGCPGVDAKRRGNCSVWIMSWEQHIPSVQDAPGEGDNLQPFLHAGGTSGSLGARSWEPSCTARPGHRE